MYKSVFIGLLVVVLSACQRDALVFGITDQEVRTDAINKESFRAELTVIKSAYADLFGHPMTGYKLDQIVSVLASTNDRTIIVDLAIRSLLNDEDVDIPSNSKMRADVTFFVNETYNRFYHRDPNPFEVWKLTEMISETASLRADEIYYAFLTSDEYKMF